MNEETAEEILCDKVKVTSPEILIEVIKDLKKLIAAGKMKQVGGSILIDAIPDQAPFNQDLIFMYFETIPGETKYSLTCETYHGLGGAFGKGTPKEWHEEYLNSRICASNKKSKD